MSNRLPATPPEQLDPEQKEIYDNVNLMAGAILGESVPFKRPSDGALIGPFPALLETPELGELGLRYLAVQQQSGRIPPAVSETAILVVASTLRAPYAIFAHTRISQENGILEPDQIAAIKAGSKPAFSDRACGLAFDVATALCSPSHQLPQKLWDEGVVLLERQGLMALVHCIGMYMYLCTLLNAMDSPSPEAKEPEKAKL